jgi:hypothetical protein
VVEMSKDKLEYFYKISRNLTDKDAWGGSYGRYKYQIWLTDYVKEAERLEFGYTFTRWGALRKIKKFVKAHNDIETGTLS